MEIKLKLLRFCQYKIILNNLFENFDILYFLKKMVDCYYYVFNIYQYVYISNIIHSTFIFLTHPNTHILFLL
jgi:hypothetical protein